VGGGGRISGDDDDDGFPFGLAKANNASTVSTTAELSEPRLLLSGTMLRLNSRDEWSSGREGFVFSPPDDSWLGCRVTDGAG
jgi:hypothetical protein